MPGGLGGGGFPIWTPPTFPTGGGGGGLPTGTGGGGGGGSIWNNVLQLLGAGGNIAGSILNANAMSGAANAATAASRQDAAIRLAILNQIQPFADMLMKWGLNPHEFLSSPQGQALLGGVMEPISQEFDAARTNFVNSSMGSGFSTGSGVSAGPLANLYQQEAVAKSGAKRDIIGQGLNLGLQGANILQGQQAQFNPNALLTALLSHPQTSVLGQGLQSFGSSLPSLFGLGQQGH